MLCLFLFCTLFVSSITRPDADAATIRYMKGVKSGDESCARARDLITFIRSERLRSLYFNYDPPGTRPIRLRQDPIVIAVDGQAIKVQQNSHIAEGETTQTSYCQHRCADTRPMYQNNTEAFLPTQEPIKDNVWSKDPDVLSGRVRGPLVTKSTEYVPSNEVKYVSLYRFVCESGYTAETVYMDWFMMSTPPEGPRRQSCECRPDPEVETVKEPGIIRGLQSECYDSAEATGPARLAVRTSFMSESRSLVNSVKVGPSQRPYQARPLVDDFHLYLAQGREVKHTRGVETMGESFDYANVQEGEVFTACAHNPNTFDIGFGVFLVQMAVAGHGKASKIG